MSARTTMECFDDRWFDFTDPKPDAFDIEGIAGSLSRICRFGGWIRWFYSVAEHACLVQRLVIEAGHPELAGEALHHDTHEAFTCDLPTPLKNAVDENGAYSALVEPIDQVIAAAFRLDAEKFHHPAIVAADRLALRMEAAVLKDSQGITGAWEWRELPELPDDWAPGLQPEQAQAAFLAAHRAIVAAPC